jgi:hypothetical protein
LARAAAGDDEDDGELSDAGVEALLARAFAGAARSRFDASAQERLDSGLSAEDRRCALCELKLLLSRTTQAQLACGHIGLPVLLSILRDDRDDIELVRGALEALLQAVTQLPHGPRGGLDAAVLNTELIGRDARSVALLLELLEVDGAPHRLSHRRTPSACSRHAQTCT